MELLIESISHNGEGVAKNRGKVVFIPYAIPGEIVKAEIIEEKKKYSRGILREIVKQSPHRIEPKCPYYYHCGGCSYHHINYNQQLLLKKDITKETILQNSFDRIIVNPPRTGVKPEVINAIVNISPEIIVYVSCNPATLARDLKQLVNNSYKVANIQPIDMFPQTSHIENIVLLQKNKLLLSSRE